MKLYELTEQYEELYNMLYDEEIDEQTILTQRKDWKAKSRTKRIITQRSSFL